MLFAYPPPIEVPLNINLWLYLIGVGLLAPALAVLLQFHRAERYSRKVRVAGLWIITATVFAVGGAGLFFNITRALAEFYLFALWFPVLFAFCWPWFKGRADRTKRGKPELVLGSRIEGLVASVIVITLWGWLFIATACDDPYRSWSRRSACKSNLKTIGMELLSYHDRHGVFPDATRSDEGGPSVSWRVDLYSFLESNRSDLSRAVQSYDRGKSWNDPVNLPIARQAAGRYGCPANGNPQSPTGEYYTAFALMTGPGTMFADGRGISYRSIADGGMNTVMAVEACGLNIVWTEPRDVDVSRELLGVNLSGNSITHSPAILSSPHLGAAHVLMADGTVHILSEKIDPQVLKAMTTAAGNERVTLP